MVKNKTFPSLKDLELVRGEIKIIRNRRGEFKRKIHYGCFLLCSESGLRIGEAVKFDLKAKTRKGLYKIEKPKGKKERYVAIPKNVELTPHNLRRAFATYQAEAGLPLPLLSKLLGHSSIRTTALYWQNIYGNDGSDDILIGKKWLETKFGDKQRPKPSQSKGLPTFPPITENFSKQLPKNSDSDIVRNKPVIAAEKPTNQDNLLLTTEAKKNPVITNYQPQKLIGEISPKNQEKFLLNTGK